MIELFSEDRRLLTTFTIPREEVCIWSCIEGIMGRAWINDLSEPVYGLVSVADFLFLLGDAPNELCGDLKNLVEAYGTNQIIVSENPDWNAVICNAFSDRIVYFTRYAFHWEPDVFDKSLLKVYAQSNNDAYKVVPFDLELADKALKHNFTADFCIFFKSPEMFLKQGVGFCIVEDDQIISGASSYSACSGAIDITIGTVEAYRRKQLGLKCAAKLILECLERGVYPRWDAANLESVELAKKLGYRLKDAYQVFTIKEKGDSHASLN